MVILPFSPFALCGGDDATFADLAEIDRKLGLPRGTSFEMGGFADYFASMDDD